MVVKLATVEMLEVINMISVASPNMVSTALAQSPCIAKVHHYTDVTCIYMYMGYVVMSVIYNCLM